MFKSKNNQAIIEEIHNTFNSASEKLLSDAMEIINQSGEHQLEKITRLKNVGFFNSNEVKKWEEVSIAKEFADLIGYYQIKYPNNKFITEKQVTYICNKYNLFCAPIDRYKGFVPDTKLKQIENFKFDNVDKDIPTVKILKAWDTGAPYGDFAFRSYGARFLHKKIGLEFIPINHRALSWHGSRLFSATDSGYVEKWKVYGAEEMLICAPKKDMDLKGLDKVGAIFKSFVTIEVPDPVVLKPCNGGYLIIAAWGLEAGDEIVVNPVHN